MGDDKDSVEASGEMTTTITEEVQRFGFFRRNTTFTQSAARWVILLSLLSILRTLAIVALFSLLVSNEYGDPSLPSVMRGYLLLSPLLGWLPGIYLILFIFFSTRRSQYAPVCFVRGIANFIPRLIGSISAFFGLFHAFEIRSQLPLYIFSGVEVALSVGLIIYVISTKRLSEADFGTACKSQQGEQNAWSWRTFFLPPLITLAILLVACLIAGVVGTAASNYSVGVNKWIRDCGVVAFIASACGIIIHFVLGIVFLIKRKGSQALGCILSIFLLFFTGFFGCVSMFANFR